MNSGIIFGPLGPDTLHVVIDMQRIFLEPGPWYGPAGLDILPAIAALIAHAPEQSLFTRFITAATPESADGNWQRYYEHWREVTQQKAGSEILALHDALLPYAPQERTFDKRTHDAFDTPDFTAYLRDKVPETLIFSGVETDVCVLATVLSAVDLGYRVIIARDAVAGSVAAAHQACLEHIYPRFDQQIEVADTAEILAAWRPA